MRRRGDPVTGYEYIIAGGGTAGCVLAARLSQDPDVRVLLLEAGPARRTRQARIAADWPALLGSESDWAGRTTPQAGAGPLPYPRGRGLGGSGLINAMAHIRGHAAVYDAWAAAGAAGWGYRDLLPYFMRSEHATGPGRDPVLRGTGGPVRVAPVPVADRHPVAGAFASALTGLGCPATADLSGAVQEGVAWPDLAIQDGQRVSPAGAYLEPAWTRRNLTIRDNSLVTGLVIRGGRCTGVRYLHHGAVAEAHSDGEVIVCAGAVGSPQLLMLSGIGPAGSLLASGITPVADLPAGAHLQDHPVVLACYTVPGPVPASRYNHGEMYAALRSPFAGDWPDLHLFPILLPAAPPGHPAPEAGFALACAVVAPASSGTVRLASADPAAAPLVDPGFLTDPADTRRLAAGLGLIRDAAAAAGFPPATHPPGAVTGTELAAWIRGAVGSYWHPAGTCRMGTGPDAVTDPALRVHGITGLRVADASVIPLIPNAPAHATVLAIAEKAADLIRGPRSLPPSCLPYRKGEPSMTTSLPRTGPGLLRYVEKRHIDHIPAAARHGKAWHQAAFWFGANVNVFNVVLGGVLVSIGLPLWWALIAIGTGTAIGALLIALHATQGPVLGVPQSLQSRAQLGVYGASFMFAAILALNIGFIAAELVIQAQSMTGISAALSMPEWIGVLAVPSVVIGIFGYRWIHAVMQATAVIVGIALVIMLIQGLRYGTVAPSELSLARPPAGLFAAGVALLVIDMLSFGPFVSDYTRYLPARTSGRRLFWCIYLGNLIATTGSCAIGAYLVALLPSAASPVAAIGKISGPWALLIMAASLVNANTFNAYTGSFQILAFASIWRRFKAESVTVRLIPFGLVMATGIITAVLGYQHFVTNLDNFLDDLLALLIPWSAVNLADYFIVRRGSYDIASLFLPDGVYGRFAWRGLTAYAAGLAAEIPFMSQPDLTGPFVHLLGGADISWIVGFLVSAAIYLLLTAGQPGTARHNRHAAPAAR
jgi:choline dehydrogenase